MLRPLLSIALCAIVVLISTPVESPAQTVTAFKTGERVSGLTKQCFYDALGSGYTRTVGSIDLCPLSIQVRTPAVRNATPATPTAPPPRTVTAFRTGEKTTGMTKQCFYNALGSEYTRTVGSIEICPLTLQVRVGGAW